MFPRLGNWENTWGKIERRERQNQRKSLKCFSISVINQSAKRSARKGASDLWSPLCLSAAHVSKDFSVRSCTVRESKCHTSFQNGKLKVKRYIQPVACVCFSWAIIQMSGADWFSQNRWNLKKVSRREKKVKSTSTK